MTFKVEFVEAYRNQGIVRGIGCRICNNGIGIGDHALYERRKNDGYTALHVECIRAIIDHIPTDESVLGQFNQIRREAEEGKTCLLT